VCNKDVETISKELNRLLKNKGKILVIEPILSKTSTRLNKWMKFVDKGKYIRFEKDLIYLLNKQFKVNELDQFITEMFYNEKVYELTKKQFK